MHDSDCETRIGHPCSCHKEATPAELRDKIDRLKYEVTHAEQKGYARAIEAERKLYDRSLAIARNDILLSLQKEFSVKLADLRNEVIEEVARFLDEQAKLKGLKTSSKGRTTMGYARQVREMKR